MKKLILLLALTFTLKTFAADLEVSNAKIKVLPSKSKVTAIYLDIKNNSDKDISLKSVSGPFAEEFELHTMEMKNGMMKMKKVDDILIQKKSTTKLESGGLNIQLFELKAPVKRDNEYEIELTFSNDHKIKTKAVGISSVENKSHSHH